MDNVTYKDGKPYYTIKCRGCGNELSFLMEEDEKRLHGACKNCGTNFEVNVPSSKKETKKTTSTPNDKKFIGMDPNILFGLNWLLFPFGIVALAIDHDKMTTNDKKQIISAFVVDAFMAIVSAIVNIIHSILCSFEIYWFTNVGYINIIPCIFVIIAMIQAFRGIDYHYPLAWNFAGLFVHENANDKKVETKENEE